MAKPTPDSEPATPSRDPWKSALIAGIDDLDGPTWKANAIAQILRHRVETDDKAVSAAFSRLDGSWGGHDKLAVRGGLGVVEAIRAAGWSIARVTPEGDVVVRAR